MFCLLLEINQLFKIKLMQKVWRGVPYFAKNLLFNFHFPSILLHSVIQCHPAELKILLQTFGVIMKCPDMI